MSFKSNLGETRTCAIEVVQVLACTPRENQPTDIHSIEKEMKDGVCTLTVLSSYCYVDGQVVLMGCTPLQ